MNAKTLKPFRLKPASTPVSNSTRTAVKTDAAKEARKERFNEIFLSMTCPRITRKEDS